MHRLALMLVCSLTALVAQQPPAEVARLLRSAGRNSEARAVLEDGLARTAPLGVSHPSRIAILNELAAFWEGDGNLLKAVGYLEQATAAESAAPAQSNIQDYIRLAALYRKLGRPDAVAAVAVKIRALGATDQAALAAFYEQRGQLAEVAAVYRKMAEQAADPRTKAEAWQSLAGFAASQQHFPEAIAAVKEAIAAAQPSEVPGVAGQTFSMRQNLARYLRGAGALDQADQVFQQLLQESRGGPPETQALLAYAQYLGETARGAQGENLLKGYLVDHPNPDPPLRVSFLYTLANLARGTGDSRRADLYVQEAQALQPPPPPPVGEIRIAEKLREAGAEAGQNRFADAYSLAVDALDAAAQAADGQSIVSTVPGIAYTLASHKESAKAEQLYRRLFALAETWKANTMQPLIAVSRSYVGFLRNQPERLGEAPAAIERHRRVLVEANGLDSATLAEPLRMSIDLARAGSAWPQAEGLARELLELQESLSGPTSEPYLADLQIAARVCMVAGDYARALPLFRGAITIADLLATPKNGWHRAETRIDTAYTLARLGQFDEAETLGEEAVAMHETMRAPMVSPEAQLEQIRQMKRIAAGANVRHVQE